LVPACRYSAGHPGGAAAHHGRPARVVTRKPGILIAVVIAAGASSAAISQSLPTDWADVEGRIQYAYYTDDARALNGGLTSLNPKPVEGEEASAPADAGSRAYFRALAYYRMAQVLGTTKKSQARDAVDDCEKEVDKAIAALPKVPLGLDETPE